MRRRLKPSPPSAGPDNQTAAGGHWVEIAFDLKRFQPKAWGYAPVQRLLEPFNGLRPHQKIECRFDSNARSVRCSILIC